MARDTATIKKELTDNWMSNSTIAELYELDPNLTFEQQFSKVSIESILFFTIAYSIHIFEQVLDLFKSDITTIVTNMKPHTVQWYISKIKSFQNDDDGILLPIDSDTYEVIDESLRIVKYCSLVEKQGYLFIKVAKSENNSPAPLSTTELTHLAEYINRIKDAGVHYELVSRPADTFRVNLVIYYDPLITITRQKVKDYISQYLSSMPFDGVYSNMGLTDLLQTMEGVKVVQIRIASANYGFNPFTTIESIYQPDAGYMSLDTTESNIIIDLIPYK
jgi:hypothetical protein